jgi:SAM-dependent methyltransferase
MTTRPCLNDEINTGVRSVLSNPAIYHFFGRIMGLQDKYRMYVEAFIKPFPGIKILDIGCGTATILKFLPIDIDYTGYDINSEYIKYAKKKYGHMAKFYNQRVNDMTFSNSDKFDVVMADGLMHHLDDVEAINLFQIGYQQLQNKGFMLTIDPAFIHGQKSIDRLITSMDRGQHVKYPEGYKNLAQSIFTKIEAHVVKGIGFFSLTGCILKCWKE